VSVRVVRDVRCVDVCGRRRRSRARERKKGGGGGAMFTSGGVKKCTQTTVCAQVDVIRSTLGDATAPARAFVDAARVFAPVRGRSRSFAVVRGRRAST